MGDLVLDDCGDDDFVDADVVVARPVSAPAPPQADALGPRAAASLRALLVGADGRSIPTSFTRQGFYFSEAVEYGLVQNEGGCCGVLAVLQAYVVKYLHFDSPGARDAPDWQDSVLADSVAGLLSWVQVASRSADMVLCLGDAADLAGLAVHRFRDVARLREAVRAALPRLKERTGSGLLLLIASCVLTRGGVAACRADMDFESPLIVEHGYCSQELVNLMLTGRCTANVFDGTMAVGGGAELKGVQHRCNVGLLTLYEHFGSITVGSHLKDPAYPIWVVCSESHYTVLFSDTRAAELTLPESSFELSYYDQLARQDTAISLRVDCSAGLSSDAARRVSYAEGSPVPPVDDCLRTKWAGAVVQWVGSDPLL